MIVILARQQLFTENTITPILPLMAEKTAQNIMCVIRLWLVVFAANMVGTLIFAAFCTFTAAMNNTVYTAMLELSRHMMQNGWWEMLVRGIVSGWLMAALVWLIPSTKGSEFLVITLMTYLIAAGDFTHVVAGSVEAFLLVLNGELNLSAMIWQFIVPVFIGNVIGGNIEVYFCDPQSPWQRGSNENANRLLKPDFRHRVRLEARSDSVSRQPLVASHCLMRNSGNGRYPYTEWKG